MSDRHLINGIPFSDYAAETDIDGLLAAPPVEGDRDYLIGLTLHGFDDPVNPTSADRAVYIARAQELAGIVHNNDQVSTLTRILDLGGGDEQETEARVRYVDGFNPAKAGPYAGRCAVRFRFDEDEDRFHAVADTPLVAPGLVVVGGRLRTRRIVIDLPGPGTLTNTTLGISVTVSGATVLDVEDFTSSNGLGLVTAQSSDMWWLELAPGPNNLTWSGAGNPGLAVRAAY